MNHCAASQWSSAYNPRDAVSHEEFYYTRCSRAAAAVWYCSWSLGFFFSRLLFFFFFFFFVYWFAGRLDVRRGVVFFFWVGGVGSRKCAVIDWDYAQIWVEDKKKRRLCNLFADAYEKNAACDPFMTKKRWLWKWRLQRLNRIWIDYNFKSVHEIIKSINLLFILYRL